MADISALFAQDDASFPMEFPGADGVVWQIRSVKNPDSEAVASKARRAMIGGRLLAKGTEIPADELGQIALMQTGTDPTDEQLAHCVTAWEWGDNTLADFDLTFNYENVLKIIQAVPRIRRMVLQRAIEVTDFTQA